MKIFFKIQIYVGALLLGFLPLTSFASELRLDASQVDVQIGEVFTVAAVLFANEPVNAVEGQILFPKDLLSVKEISDGNSSINLWIERPESIASGMVAFSGITPGGFSGVNNLLFSVVFEAKKTGSATISLKDAKALKNDGLGTEAALALRNVVIEVKAGDGSSQEKEVKDTVKPEPFALTIANDSTIADGKWFVVFATTDKGAGISHYKIKEYRFPAFKFFVPWRIANSPHILSDQELKSYIVVRAVDNRENVSVTKISPTNQLLWHENVFYWFIFIIVALGALYGLFKIAFSRFKSRS